MPRSIRVHPDHRQAVAIALERNGFLTQGDLAAHLEIALSTVSNFFRGVNVSISKFEQICEALGIEAKAIIQAQTPDKPQDAPGLDPTIAQGEYHSDALASHFFAYDEAWVGRESLVNDLKQRICGHCRLLLLTGITGIGKTALAERLSADLYLDWLSGNRTYWLRENFDDQEQSADFCSVATRLLEKCGQIVLKEIQGDAPKLLDRLFSHFQNHRYLIVLDSLEEILQGNETASEFQDAGFLKWLQRILATDTFESRLIITTQELPNPLLEYGSRYRNVWFNQPLKGLTAPEQLTLFERTGLAFPADAVSHAYLTRIGKAYEGHPLALRVIAGEIGSAPFFGNVVAYWRKYGSEIEAVEQAIAAAVVGEMMGAADQWQLDRFSTTLRRNVATRLEQTFNRLKQQVRFAYLMLCETAVYRCAVPEDWWLSHLEDWNCDLNQQIAAFEALRDRFLVEESIEQDQYLVKQHPLIRSVSLQHLQQFDDAEP